MIDFKSFVWGLISCAVYDFLKTIFSKRGVHYQKYSKEHVLRIKLSFYLFSSLTAFCFLIPISKYEFLNILLDVLSGFFLLFAVFAFMSLNEVMNDVLRQSEKKNTDKD